MVYWVTEYLREICPWNRVSQLYAGCPVCPDHLLGWRWEIERNLVPMKKLPCWRIEGQHNCKHMSVRFMVQQMGAERFQPTSTILKPRFKRDTANGSYLFDCEPLKSHAKSGGSETEWVQEKECPLLAKLPSTCVCLPQARSIWVPVWKAGRSWPACQKACILLYAWVQPQRLHGR